MKKAIIILLFSCMVLISSQGSNHGTGLFGAGKDLHLKGRTTLTDAEGGKTVIEFELWTAKDKKKTNTKIIEGDMLKTASPVSDLMTDVTTIEDELTHETWVLYNKKKACMDISEPDTDKPAGSIPPDYQNTKKEKLGKEKVGKWNCYKYKITDEQEGITYVWENIADGIPVKLHHTGSDTEVLFEVIEYDTKTVSAKEFEIPKDYKKVENMMELIMDGQSSMPDLKQFQK